MLYEDQALRYDLRAGIPAETADAVADALADLTALAPGQTLLEVGVGTGVPSLPLVRRPLRYIGFDRAPAMLAVFREKLAAAGLEASLHVADGNARWPAADGSVSVVFSARAIHHLDPAHVAAEVARVAHPAGVWLVLGQVRREAGSMRVELRRAMQRELRARGYAPRSHRAHAEALFGLLQQQGGRPAPPRVAARWTTTSTPAETLAAWAGKAGLAGRDVPAAVKAEVLTAVAAWAAARYDDLEAPHTLKESFELRGLLLPGSA